MADKKEKFKLRLTQGPRVDLPADILSQALEAYEAGRYSDACGIAVTAGNPQNWRGGAALAFGFRLAGNCGHSRLASLLISRGRREAPSDPEVTVHYGYHLRHVKGPMVVWRYARQAEALSHLPDRRLADLKALRAGVAGHYRDFETAWKLWDEAEALAPGDPWLLVERAGLLMDQEQKEAALEALDQALAIRPWYRPAVQQRGRVLHLLGRWQEAIDHLAESLLHLQSYALAVQLLVLKREVDDHAGMADLVAQAEKLAVLRGQAELEWLRTWQADILYLKGDYTAAASAASAAFGDFYSSFAARLRQATAPGKRVRLPFQFVHQKQNTCVPATLAALARFWDRPVQMEQIADAICYDGTYDYSERAWTEANGFTAREFTVTSGAARTLIDAGVPFAVTTVEIGSGHSQAVIGYDELRDTLFIQDPSEPHFREVPAAAFLEEYQLAGPRGLVLVPPARGQWLADLLLPDCDLYDVNHRFNLALSEYRREDAEAHLCEMESLAPQHRLVLMARLTLANFDSNDLARAEAVERLLQVYPKDHRVLNWKLAILRTFGTRAERLALLRVHAAEHPAFLRELGFELLSDARDWPEARRVLWRAHSRLPAEGAVLVHLADLLRLARLEEGGALLHYYRFAAAFSDKVEGYAQTWFSFALSQGRADAALQWLRRRFSAYGARSGAPALTLAQALDSLCNPEAVDVLRKAVALRPDDGDLLLQLARFESRLGSIGEAASLLERARAKVTPGNWLRARAALLRWQGIQEEEAQVWRLILEREPLAMDAHAFTARQLSITGGNSAAIAYLESVVARFPHHYGLAQLLIQWQREEDGLQAAAQLRQLIERHPEDSWAHRELALTLRGLGRHADALASAQAAVAVAPHHAASHGILGLALSGLSRDVEATQCFRDAIRLDVNCASAYDGLLRVCSGTDKQREELAFIRQEMIRQVLDGTGLHAYRAYAFTVLSQDQLLAELREIWEARPDLWEAWSVLSAQLIDCGQKAEALALATGATERFALTPAAWKDLATIQKLAGEISHSVSSARRAVELNPDWSEGWQFLAECLEHSGDAAAAEAALRSACARLPNDPALLGSLAFLLWRLQKRDEAWNLAVKVTEDDPAQTWAWSQLHTWSAVLQKRDYVYDAARRLTRERPLEARSWLLLAQLLPPAQMPEILAALDKAVELNPTLVDAYDLRAELLARLGRLDEAETSISSGPWHDQNLPFTLQGRRAWLLACRGDLSAAMRSMRNVLMLHTDYYWGWERLADWAENKRDLAAWREAGAALMRLNPRAAAPYSVAADAELHANCVDNGIALLRQALHVEPANAYAAHRLLDFYWTNKKYEELAAAASALPGEGVTGLIRRVYLLLLAARERRVDEVRAELHDLASHPDLPAPLVNAIRSHFHANAKLRHVFDTVLTETARDDLVGPAFATAWVERETLHKRWQCWRQLVAWLPRLGSRLDPAFIAFLNQAADAGAADPHVMNLIREAADHLRQSTALWAQVGYALTRSECFAAAIDWMGSDYKRPDVEGWMLSNLMVCLRARKRLNEAAEVSAYAVSEGLRDQTWPMHVGVVAHHWASRGQREQALQLLNRHPVTECSPDWRLLAMTARGLCDVMGQPPRLAGALFKDFLRVSKGFLQTHPVSDTAFGEYQAAIARMKGHSGVNLLPWQMPRRGKAVSPRDRGPSSDFFSKFGLLFVVVVVLNSWRLCSQHPYNPNVRTQDFTRDLPALESRTRATLENFNSRSLPPPPPPQQSLPLLNNLPPFTNSPPPLLPPERQTLRPSLLPIDGIDPQRILPPTLPPPVPKQ
jgi:predicted Zn-dependent protease